MTDHLPAPAETQPDAALPAAAQAPAAFEVAASHPPSPHEPPVPAAFAPPGTNGPPAEEPMAERVTGEPPADERPAAEQPVVEEAALGQPEPPPLPLEHPIVAQPVTEHAIVVQPVAEHAIVVQPVAEQRPAAAAEPAAGQPAAGQPAAEPPVVAEPAGPSKADLRRERAQEAWERVVNAHEHGETLTGSVTVAVKGGLLVDIGGIRGFLPASQARVPIGTAIETLVKTRVPLKIIDIDQGRRRAVVSHRRAVEDERRARRTELLRSLEVGQTREGVVVRLADFGAFVDLGGIDGLIPMRELAFERVDKVGDVLAVGDKLPVQVLRIEENGKKISLSRKNALPDPWRDHADAVRRGAVVQGKVVGKDPRLQVEIAPGIVGMVRESDADPAQYEIGEEIEVAVRSADRATRRIVLTTMHGAAAQAQAQAATTTSGFAPLGVELTQRSKQRR
jgi:predicted RNA-binding protein with RPS1 domain